MSDPKIPKLYHRDTPHWQQAQREQFWQLNEGKSEYPGRRQQSPVVLYFHGQVLIDPCS